MDAPYRFGSFELSADERVIRRAGAAVPLAPKAIDVLLELVKHAGQIVDKHALLEAIWPDTYVDEANLTQTIYVLRSFLKENDCGITIENIPKRGYCLHVAAPAIIAPQPSTPRARRSPGFSRGALIGAVAFAFALALTGAMIPTFHRSASLDARATATYLLAKHYQLRGSLPNLQRSDRLYATIERDYPQSALGYAGRAQTTASLAFYADSLAERSRLQGLAAEFADAAMRRDARSATAYAALGGVQMSVRHDDAAASASFARALELDPNEESALSWQGTILLKEGRLEQARRMFARAVSLSPDVPGTLASLAWTDFLLGDYAEAIAFSKQMLRANALVSLARLTLANAYIERKEYGNARRVIADLARNRGTRLAAMTLDARLDAVTGHARTAIGSLRQAEATIDPDSIDDWDASSMAAAYVAVRNAPDAFVWLARVSPGERRQIARDPRFISLQASSRFRTWVQD